MKFLASTVCTTARSARQTAVTFSRTYIPRFELKGLSDDVVAEDLGGSSHFTCRAFCRLCNLCCP